MLFLPKSNPTPMARVNPFIRLNLNTGAIERNPEFQEVLDKTDRLLKGHYNASANLTIDVDDDTISDVDEPMIEVDIIDGDD